MAAPRSCDCGQCTRCKHRERSRASYWRNRDRVLELAKASRERNSDRARAYDRARGYRADPVKAAARKAVRRALRQGRIVRFDCEVCGDPETQAHHDDYSLPLVVRWLCRTHHGEAHRQPQAAVTVAPEGLQPPVAGS